MHAAASYELPQPSCFESIPSALMKRGPDEFMHSSGFTCRKKTALASSSATAAGSISETVDAAGREPSLREVLGGMFLSNKLSALDVSSISKASYAEGNPLIKAIAKLGNWGKAPKNLARDVMRELLKGIEMPPLFYWKIPLWNPEKLCAEDVDLPFLLPHEMIHHLVNKYGTEKFLLQPTGPWHRLQSAFCTQFAIDESICVAIGMHGDGVPFTKTDSLEMLSWNFLAHAKADRLPITAISKKHLCQCGCKGQHTWHAIFKVIHWSFLCLFSGVVCDSLPDSKPWSPEFSQGRLASGFRLAVHGFLLQMRGDWPYLKALFSVPSWTSKQICWKCKAGNVGHEVRPFTDTSAAAAWRRQRYAPGEFLQMLLTTGVRLCPLLGLPTFTMEMIVLDWLHVVDLGVGPDCLGNFFYECISSLLPGNTQQQRVGVLWGALRRWYMDNKPPSRLDHLTLEMIKNKKSKPKLRCKGAEARYLIPFAAWFSNAYKDRSTHFATVAKLFHHLLQLQHFVGGSLPWCAAQCAEHCRRLCTLYAALQEEAREAGNYLLWHMKPKVHLLQEMIEYQAEVFGNPAEYWTYRDESWCGYWASCSRRRGGANSAARTTERFLNRYRALDTAAF